MVNIAIIHKTFYSQFERLSLFLAKNPYIRVYMLLCNGRKETRGRLQIRPYCPKTQENWLPLEKEAEEGRAVVRALKNLQETEHFVPDLILGTCGWGAMLFVKDLYPHVKTIGYFEWFYHAFGSDVAFWPDETVSLQKAFRIRLQNASLMLQLDACDIRYTPMEWQKAQFPKEYRDSMHVIHEGIDTDFYKPDPEARFRLANLDLSGAQEIVTYGTRGMEPYRGFPVFMDAVRILQKRRPRCEVVIAGNDQTFYGRPPANGKTWKEIELEKGGLDLSRLHFVGWLTRQEERLMLQAGTVHVYLTRPFFLSWSMLEAMSTGCCLVSSATPPVLEVVRGHDNGLLADFRSAEEIAARIEEALDDASMRQSLGLAARNTVLERYSLPVCLQKQMDMIFGITC